MFFLPVKDSLQRFLQVLELCLEGITKLSTSYSFKNKYFKTLFKFCYKRDAYSLWKSGKLKEKNHNPITLKKLLTLVYIK